LFFSYCKKPNPQTQKLRSAAPLLERKRVKPDIGETFSKDDLEPKGLIPLPQHLLRSTEKKLDLNEAKAKALAADLKHDLHPKKEQSQ